MKCASLNKVLDYGLVRSMKVFEKLKRLHRFSKNGVWEGLTSVFKIIFKR